MATAAAEKFNTGAKHAWGFFDTIELWTPPSDWPRQYDLVTCCEVYEHVLDTEAFVAALHTYIKPGGRLILTTPRGSWLMGMQTTYHEKWNEQKPREHVRAPVYEDVESDLKSAGFTDIHHEIATVPQNTEGLGKIPGQATLCISARKNA